MLQRYAKLTVRANNSLQNYHFYVYSWYILTFSLHVSHQKLFNDFLLRQATRNLLRHQRPREIAIQQCAMIHPQIRHQHHQQQHPCTLKRLEAPERGGACRQWHGVSEGRGRKKPCSCVCRAIYAYMPCCVYKHAALCENAFNTASQHLKSVNKWRKR